MSVGVINIKLIKPVLILTSEIYLSFQMGISALSLELSVCAHNYEVDVTANQVGQTHWRIRVAIDTHTLPPRHCCVLFSSLVIVAGLVSWTLYKVLATAALGILWTVPADLCLSTFLCFPNQAWWPFGKLGEAEMG